MANKIAETFDIQATLIPGSGGIFDVTVNGDLIFSKHTVGNFPNEEVLLQEMRERYK